MTIKSHLEIVLVFRVHQFFPWNRSWFRIGGTLVVSGLWHTSNWPVCNSWSHRIRDFSFFETTTTNRLTHCTFPKWHRRPIAADWSLGPRWPSTSELSLAFFRVWSFTMSTRASNGGSCLEWEPSSRSLWLSSANLSWPSLPDGWWARDDTKRPRLFCKRFIQKVGIVVGLWDRDLHRNRQAFHLIHFSWNHRFRRRLCRKADPAEFGTG